MTEPLHLTDDDLVLHYYGEDVPRAESHLAACAACQANLTRLQRVMAFIDSAPPVEAPDGFERNAWARLEPAIGAPRRGWFSWFVVSPARLAFAAARRRTTRTIRGAARRSRARAAPTRSARSRRVPRPAARCR